MKQNEERQAIRDFIQDHATLYEFSDDDNIFKLGFVNSMFAMQLVAFVEDAFGIAVEDDDLELDNFNSVAALDRFVSRKRGRPVADPSAP